MKIWKLNGLFSDFSDCEYIEGVDKEIIRNKFRKCEPIINWEPINVTHNLSKPLGDLAYCCDNSDIFIVREKVKNDLSEFKDRIQFLEAKSIEYPNQKFYFMYIHKNIEAFDHERSKYDINERGGFITAIIKYAFNETARNEPIFKLRIDSHVRIGLFVNDYFKETVEKNGLTGFDFWELYDFETGISRLSSPTYTE